MFILGITLTALSAACFPEDTDTIRRERLEEVIITSNSAAPKCCR